MPTKALVDFAFIKELGEIISIKDKRFFRAKLKKSLNNGKGSKKIEDKIRHLLLAAAKNNKKSRKKKDSGGRPAKRTKPDKRGKTFTQFEAGSGTGSGTGTSSGSSSESESESAPDDAKQNTEASSASSGSESENGEKINNWNT